MNTNKDVFRILHLADLHVQKLPAVSDERDRWWERRIRRLAGVHGFDVMVCSGDIGFKGDLRNGFSYLRRLRQMAAGSAHRSSHSCPPLVLTPGNHDVGRPEPSGLLHWNYRRRFDSFLMFAREIENCVLPPITRGSLKDHRWISPNGKILIVPLCTAWLSGTAAPRSDEISELLKALPKDAGWKRASKQLERFLSADIPIVTLKQRESLTQILAKLPHKNPPLVRIAVAHHPLWPLPYLQETYRPYDITTNGMATLEKLQHGDFQVLLHGHKHYLGSSLLTGLCSRVDGRVIHMRECLSASGGHLITSLAGKHRSFGFQTIEIDLNPDNGAYLVVNDHFEHQEETDPVPSATMLIENSRKPRWTQIHEDGNGRDVNTGANRLVEEEWHLRSTVIRELGIQELMQAFEAKWSLALKAKTNIQCPSSENPPDCFLRISVRSLREIAEQGHRGVDAQFIQSVRKRAENASAMLFVDLKGNGTWGQPDLVENAAKLFRVYSERNIDRFTQEMPVRSWKHSIPAIEKARARVDTKPMPRSDLLCFDLARLLVWEPESLWSPSAQVLLRLHKVFRVPIFFVDARRLTQLGISLKEDFHLEWGDSLREPSASYRYDSKTGRRQLTNSTERDIDWFHTQQLLRIAVNPFKIADAAMAWLV